MKPALQALHQPFNNQLEVDLFAILSEARTPWGVLRQALRELAARETAVLQIEAQIEAARRKLLWAWLTLRPAAARAWRASIGADAHRLGIMREQATQIEQRADAVLAVLPDDLDPETVQQLEALELAHQLEHQIHTSPQLAASLTRTLVDLLPQIRDIPESLPGAEAMPRILEACHA